MMATKTPTNFGTSKLVILAPALAAILTTVACVFLFMQIDHTVRSELYQYGLQFSDEWARLYWGNSTLIITSLALGVTLIGVSLFSSFVYHKTGYTFAKFSSFILPIIGAVFAIFSGYLLTQVDYIIHNTLYQYGLQFNLEWANNYWSNQRLLFVLLALTSILALSSTAMIFLKPHQLKANAMRIVNFTLVMLGAVTLAFSIGLDSSILAFVGLGLLFWGVTFAYVRKVEYVKKGLFELSLSSVSSSLDQALQATGYEGDVVYLPPKYFEEPAVQKVYVTKLRKAALPTPEQMEQDLDKNNPQGILLTPPGAELVQLFEKILNTSLIATDLHYLQEHLPGLLVENLEVAQNFEMEIKGDRIHVKLENSAFKVFGKENNQLKLALRLGSPLSSALAVALAKASGKPVVIEDEQGSGDKNVVIVYRMLEEEGQASP